MAVGAAPNFAAIAANSGMMPALPEALAHAGLVADKGEAFANSAAGNRRYVKKYNGELTIRMTERAMFLSLVDRAALDEAP